MTLLLAQNDRLMPIGPETGALAAALDPGLAAAALHRALGSAQPPTRVLVERVHFSDARPTVIHYRVHPAGGGDPELVLAELIGDSAAAHAEAEIVSLSKLRRGQLPKAGPHPIAADPDSGLTFRPPGLDNKLPGMKLLHAPEHAANLAAIALGLPCVGTTASVRLHSHRLGKRAVLRVELRGVAGPRRLFLRLRPVTSESGMHAFDLHCEVAARLARDGGVPVPTPLGYEAGIGVALMGAIHGSRPVLRNGPSGVREVQQCLRTVERLHNITTASAAPYGVADELALLRSWVARVSVYLPGLADTVARAFEVVSEALTTLPVYTPATIHRDFYEGQLLIDGTRAGLLDFDTARMSDPMLDIGNFIAHVRLAALVRGADLRALERAAACWPGHRRAPEATTRIAAWTRAALLRLACIYAFTHKRDRVVLPLIAAAAT